MSLSGVKIVGDMLMVRSQHRQFRFPRSKKRRIRNKWAKRAENFRDYPVVYMIDGVMHVHPDWYDALLAAALRKQSGRPVLPSEDSD